MQDLRGRAQDLRRAVQYPVDSRTDEIADVISQRRRLGRQGAEDQIAERVDAQLLQSVLIELEALRHAAAPGHPAARGDALEVAFEIVTPGVIDAGQIVRMTAPFEADEVPAMGAALQHGEDLAIMTAR